MPPGPPPNDRHDHGGPKVPVTWLGVDTSPIPPVLCDQMNLPKGFGLVVDYVVPDSPAATAGIQQNDILKLLNDQILMEPSQLAKLIRNYSEGTAITLTVLRKGKEEKVSVKLGKKEVPQRHGMDMGRNFPFGDHDFGGFSEKMNALQEQLGNDNQGMIHDAVMKAQAEAQRVRDEAQRRRDEAQRVRDVAQRAREEAQRQRERAHEEAQRMSEGLREEMRRAAGHIQVTRNGDNGLQTTRIDMDKAQIVFSDDKGELRVEKIDGKKVLTAKDPQGRLLFSGPVETKEDLDKVPADVRKRYDNLQEKDLPSVISGGNQDHDSDADADDNDNDNDDDADDDDDNGGGAMLEQASFCPQSVSHSIWAYHTILI